MRGGSPWLIGMKKKLLIAFGVVVVVGVVIYARLKKPDNWRAMTWKQKLQWLTLRAKAETVDGSQYE